MVGLTSQVRASALYLQIDRPERENRLDRATLEAMTAELARAEGAGEARVVVISGSGTDFCAGGQVDGLAEGDVDRQLAFADAFIGLHTQIRRMGTPVVCAVNGRCHAAGMSLLLAADMAVAADHATFGYPEIEAGLFPVLALASAVRLLPRKVAFELCYTGRLLSAQEALNLGIINKVVPHEELAQATSDLVAAIASRNQRSLRIGRLAFHVMERADPDFALEYAKPSLVSLLAGKVPKDSGWA